ncbi:MAG: TIGR00730 family Rossman fold protein [bacterium]
MDIFKGTKKSIPNGMNSGQVCRVPLTGEERELAKQYGYVPRMSDITWRIFRIMAEFVEGFQFLSRLSSEVTIFGSARTPTDNKWYREAEKLGRLLANGGFTVVTGGGPGIMEAANKGAFEAGGESVGLNIQLPREQRINPYVKSARAFHYFFTRKVILAASAQAYVFFPGGFGTNDELFEILTLIQTEKSEKVPVVMVGLDYWSDWLRWVKGTMLEEFGTIDRADLEIFEIVDNAEQAFEIIQSSKERSFF